MTATVPNRRVATPLGQRRPDRFLPPRLLPTPGSVVSRVLPQGIPLLRDEFLARTNVFGSALDPNATPGDPGLFGPDSVTWRIVSHPTQALAGLRGALLQTLSVPVPTAVHSTGAFYEDFLGRVARTGAYLQAQNLGSMDEVYKSARRVRAMHRVVQGVGSDGTRFDATDLHQTAWVSMTMTDSYLAIARRFGPGRLSRSDADRFVREQSTHAALLDHRIDLDAVFRDPKQRRALQQGRLDLPLIAEGELPTTYDQMRSLMRAWTTELGVSKLTRALLDATVSLSEADERTRTAARPFVLATLSTIPDDWHDLIAPTSRRLAEFAAAEALQYPLAALTAVVGELPSVRTARQRAAAR